MRAEELDEQFLIVDAQSDALDAARMIAEHSLPGLIIVDAARKPYAVLLASEVLHTILPRYVQDDSALAGVMGDVLADHTQTLAGRTVGEIVRQPVRKPPTVDARDGLIKVAAEMAQLRCPLIAVTKNGTVHGVITASRLLAAALKS